MIEANDGRDEAALRLFGEARALAGRNGALRPLVHAAINESHVLEGTGEHERAAQLARDGITSAADYGLARTTGTFLAINVAEPLVSLGRWDEAIEVVEHALALSPPRLNRLALRIVAGGIAVRRGDVAAARAAAEATRESFNRAPYRGHRACQYYLPQAQLEAEVCAADGRTARALDAITAMDDQFDLARDRRYAWPLITTGARICTAAGPAGPDRALARQAAELLARLAELAGKMDALGPVQQAWRLTFTAVTGSGPGGPALVQWDAAVTAWDRLAEPYQVATALLGAAEAALAAGDRDGAARRLRRAAQLADQLGARPLSVESARAGPACPAGPGCGPRGAAAQPGPAGPDRARVRGAAPGSGGPVECGDRRRAVHRAQDGQRARVQHPGQARREQPRRGGGHRAPAPPVRPGASLISPTAGCSGSSAPDPRAGRAGPARS